tara:strand:- start:6440 stop:7102 length:663 start_codon:yes stop_codon:yes gene_type:complete
MLKAKILGTAVAITILAGFSYLAISSGITAEKLQVKTIKLESTEEKLKDVNQEVKKLKTQSSQDKEKRKKLEKEKAELERQLQAKAEAKAKLARAAEAAASAVTSNKASAAPIPTIQITGNKQSWLVASGIPEHEWGYVDAIVSRESGWDPCAYNPGQSDCNASPTSACGLAQSLPCGKQSVYGHWTNPVANLKWMNDYVNGRYGGWAQAVAFWSANRWY